MWFTYNQLLVKKRKFSQLERYGQSGFTELQNGRFRYYGNVTLASSPGEMISRRVAREWNPTTGNTRTWMETLDGAGNIRIVRPETGGPKVHFMFNQSGKFIKKMVNMNVVSFQDIEQILNQLLDGEISREDASKWAFNLRKEADENNLRYNPENYEAILWEGILFLEGIDLQIEPSVYLHSIEDLYDFLLKIRGKLK